MSEGRIVGGCCGGFPEPEVNKKKEEGCCGSGDCGCGPGPAREGSVRDASGSGLSQKNERFHHLIELCSGSKFILDDEQFSIFSDTLSLYLRGRNAASVGIRCREIGSETESWQIIYFSHLVRRCDYVQSVSDIEPVGRATAKEQPRSLGDRNGIFGPNGPDGIGW